MKDGSPHPRGQRVGERGSSLLRAHQFSLTVTLGGSPCSDPICLAADNETTRVCGGLSSGMMLRAGVC